MTAQRSSLAPLLESFFRRTLAQHRGASAGTIAAYRDALKLLIVYVSERRGRTPSELAVEDLDRESVLAFLDHLEAVRGNAVRTRNARLTAIRSFFQHVSISEPALVGVAQRVIQIPGKLTDEKMVGFLEKEEVDALLAAPDRARALGRRDHALLLFLVKTGARESEAKDVDVRHLRLTKPRQVLLRGKGAKERVVPLEEPTAQVLADLQLDRGIIGRPDSPIFSNRAGARMSRFGVIFIVRKHARSAAKAVPSLGTRNISPHLLRHTCAMNLLRAGVDLSTIRSWLGHVHIDTTHHYAEADLTMKALALSKSGITTDVGTRHKPTDDVLALLESL